MGCRVHCWNVIHVFRVWTEALKPFRARSRGIIIKIRIQDIRGVNRSAQPDLSTETRKLHGNRVKVQSSCRQIPSCRALPHGTDFSYCANLTNTRSHLVMKPQRRAVRHRGDLHTPHSRNAAVHTSDSSWACCVWTNSCFSGLLPSHLSHVTQRVDRTRDQLLWGIWQILCLRNRAAWFSVIMRAEVESFHSAHESTWNWKPLKRQLLLFDRHHTRLGCFVVMLVYKSKLFSLFVFQKCRHGVYFCDSHMTGQ